MASVSVCDFRKLVKDFAWCIFTSDLSYAFYADASIDVASPVVVPGESKKMANLLSGLKISPEGFQYEAWSEGDDDEIPLFTCRDIETLPDETLKELLPNLVRILDETRKTGDIIGIDEYKFDTEDGEMYVPVCWPQSQSLMGKRGFRANSQLIDKPGEYEKYGDSAYWVRYLWLHPRKK